MRIVALVLALMVSALVHAETADLDDPDNLGAWITYYYKQPEPARIADAVLAASKAGFFKDGKASPPFFGFLAGWFSDNWDSADTVVATLTSLPDEDQPVLILGLWYTGNPEAKAMLKKYSARMSAQEKLIDQLASSGQPSLIQIPLEQGPWVLDALWGNFMATGKDTPVVRIMSALPWASVKGDIPRLLVGGSAKWSLASNAAQHPRVLEICRQQLRRQPKSVSVPLAEVIRTAEKELRKEKKSGS